MPLYEVLPLGLKGVCEQTGDYEIKVKLHDETMNDIEAVNQREHLSDEHLIPYLLAGIICSNWTS